MDDEVYIRTPDGAYLQASQLKTNEVVVLGSRNENILESAATPPPLGFMKAKKALTSQGVVPGAWDEDALLMRQKAQAKLQARLDELSLKAAASQQDEDENLDDFLSAAEESDDENSGVVVNKNTLPPVEAIGRVSDISRKKMPSANPKQ